MSPSQEAMREVACRVLPRVEDDAECAWGRWRSEWFIKVSKPYRRLHFSEPGRTRILTAFNAWGLTVGTDFVEIPGITEIDDPAEAWRMITEWVAMSGEEQYGAVKQWEAERDTHALEVHREARAAELPELGYVRGGKWTRHLAMEAVRAEWIKHGRNAGDSRVVCLTACGQEKTLEPSYWGDSSKPMCEQCTATEAYGAFYEGLRPHLWELRGLPEPTRGS